MKPGSGKAKGAEFERAVCEKLSLWISHGERDDLFWRSAMSGGRATLKSKKGAQNITQVGDITALSDKSFIFSSYFSVECKFYADLNIQQGLFKGTGNIANFWRHHSQACAKIDRIPLMVVKQNRLPAVCISDYEGSVILSRLAKPFLSTISLSADASPCAFFWFSNLLASRYNLEESRSPKRKKS